MHCSKHFDYPLQHSVIYVQALIELHKAPNVYFFASIEQWFIIFAGMKLSLLQLLVSPCLTTMMMHSSKHSVVVLKEKFVLCSDPSR